MVGEKIGIYRIIRELGAGAFGRVFEVNEEFNGRVAGRAALKIIEPQSLEHRESILNELQVLSNLRHLNLVPYRTFGELPSASGQKLDPVYIALDFADGGTLTTYYQTPMSQRQLLELARDVGQGLAFLARKGVTHRDIKPDNLLLYRRDEAVWRISDLGLAAPTRTDGRQTGAAGTRIYMAPEAWRGQISPSIDVWALGLCLYEAVVRERMWNGMATGALEYAVCEMPLPLDIDVVPLCLRAIVTGALERDPAKRLSAATIVQIAQKELAQLQEEVSGDLIVSQGGGGQFATLKDAIEAAPVGARLAVLPGYYVENVVIEREITLVGFDPQGGRSHNRVIIESGAGNALKITAGRVEIQGIGFRGTAAHAGKKFHAVAVTKAEVCFKDCTFTSDSLAGLMAGEKSHVTLDDCRIANGPGDGILLQDEALLRMRTSEIEAQGKHGISIKKAAHLELENCKIGATKNGVNLAEGASATLIAPQISGCENGVAVGEGTKLTLQGGKISGNRKHGVCAARGAVATIENTDARGNGFGAWEAPFGSRVSRSNTQPQ